MHPPANPALASEILDDVLALAVRRNLNSHPLRNHTSLSTRILPLLNTLPRDSIPTVSRILLMRLPWVSLDLAARLGHIWMLDTLVYWRHVYPLQFSRNWLVEAAKAGHVHVFEWWESKRSASFQGKRLPIQCDLYGIMDAASGQGHVEILQWWKVHVLDAPVASEQRMADERYSSKAVDDASQGGHVECLKWWLKESGLPIKFTSAAIRTALGNKHHAVLDWWSQSGLDFKATFRGAEIAAMTPVVLRNLDLVGFQWLIANNLATFSDMTALCALTDDPNMSFFRACAALVPGGSFTTAHLPLPHAFSIATQAGRVDILNDLLTLHNRLPSRGSIMEYLKFASQRGHVHVLDRWFARASPALFTFDAAVSEAIHVAAAAGGHLTVLEWWSSHVLAANPTLAGDTQSAIEQAAANGHLTVLQWFMQWAAVHQQDMVLEQMMRNANGHSYALKAGHAHVIRWAAANRWFASIPEPELKPCMQAAALSGHCDAIEAYIECVCRVRVGNAKAKDKHALDSGLKGDGTLWWTLVPGLDWSNSTIPWHNWVFSRSWIVDSLTRASKCGDLRTLNWWAAQGGVPSMSPSEIQDAMQQASMKEGHVDILDWWCLIGAKGRFSRTCRRFADRFRFMCAKREPVDAFVLEWWMSSPFRLFGTSAHVYEAMIHGGQVRLMDKVIENWKRLSMERYKGKKIYQLAAESGQVDVLDWWHTKQQRKYSPHGQDNGTLVGLFGPVLFDASCCSHLHVLNWWKHSSGVACAAQVPFGGPELVKFHPIVVDWWLHSNLLPAGNVGWSDILDADDEEEYQNYEHHEAILDDDIYSEDFYNQYRDDEDSDSGISDSSSGGSDSDLDHDSSSDNVYEEDSEPGSSGGDGSEDAMSEGESDLEDGESDGEE